MRAEQRLTTIYASVKAYNRVTPMKRLNNLEPGTEETYLLNPPKYNLKFELAKFLLNKPKNQAVEVFSSIVMLQLLNKKHWFF